jgi:UDP-N-acetylmuramate dehydrogenase
VSATTLARAEDILRAACGDRVRTAFPLAPLTTFRLGGPAALFLEPESMPDLYAASRAVREADVPVLVLGKGSNVLVSDRGFPGLVLRLGRGFKWTGRQGSRLSPGGAVPLPAVAGVALQHGLSGLEFGVAIPASLGGSVAMNAGAHGHSLDEVLETIEVFVLGDGVVRRVPAAEAGFRYRGSDLPPDGVIIGATVSLQPGKRERIRELMDEAREWRRRTQPLAEPNCGSVFTNPPEDHAARLVEVVGGKGMRVGGAAVSMKHSNFIVADAGATASDVLTLIRRLQELVAERFGVDLDLEVRLVGEFGDKGKIERATL